MFIYESHLGGLFANEEDLNVDELYCEECGDFDTCIGEADTRKKARALLKSYYDEEDYALNRTEIRKVLDKSFEQGCYEFVQAFRFVEVDRDDDDFIVLSITESFDPNNDFPTEYFCGTKTDALNFAGQFEKNIFSIADRLNEKIADEIPAIAEEHGRDALYDMLPHIMDELERKIVVEMHKS